MNNLIETFQSPGSAYRGKPFWAWNGKLEEGELRRQIRVMKQMGLGGFFMHSRVGLGTAYLSKEWFDLINACVDEAKKHNMEAWLYDEDRWSSGAAGGFVTKNKKYRQRFLMWRTVPAKDFKWNEKYLAAFTAELGPKDTAKNVKRLKKGQAAPKDSTVLTFAVELAPESSWYNGYTYLDTLSHEAVREFIKVTHEAYLKNVGKEFGGTIPGIFTDEPNFGGAISAARRKYENEKNAGQTAWTDRLPEVFKKRYGYDIMDRLPEIFLDVDGKTVSPARHDYMDCLTFLFSDAFGRQIGEWCEKNGIAMTGHVLEELTPLAQSQYVGSAMRFYEHMQKPGIDILTQTWYEYDTAKQCSSVLHQMGRTWMLSELYGCTGWYFTFEGHKAIGDWQAALGVNLRCQHLAWYTMEGEAKRDYPASISYQSPWWQLYSKVEDYFSRVGVLMTQGQPVRDLLVIHPVESTWLRMRANSVNEPEEMDATFKKVRDTLLQNHIDYDYGDEEMLSRLARVAAGKNGAQFKLGKASYRAILVPPMITMRKTTLDLLRRFAKAGGLVIFAGDVAEYLDAKSSGEAKKLAAETKRINVNAAAFSNALDSMRTISIADGKGKEIATALYMLRSDASGRYLFICNTDRTKGFEEVKITLDGAGFPEEWDGATGERFAARVQQRGNKLVISASLPPTGSLLFRIPKKKTPGLKPRPFRKTLRKQALGGEKWNIQLGEENVLVLDRPEYRIGDGKFQRATEILKVDRAVRSSLNIPWRGGEMVQPWARKSSGEKAMTAVCLRYTFNIEVLPSGRLDLGLETPDIFAGSLNGYAFDTVVSDSGWWTDRAIRRIPLDPAHLVKGKNVIELTCAYHEDVNFEASFLLGNFGVRLEGTGATIIEEPETLTVGDWGLQGLPFFSGAITYRAKLRVAKKAAGERVVLSVPNFQGACVRVFVDGHEAGILGWAPYELDITDLVKGKEVEVAIEVYGSRHNAFGPLHIKTKEMEWVGPGEYVTEGKKWQEEYNLKPYGLMGKVAVEYRK